MVVLFVYAGTAWFDHYVVWTDYYQAMSWGVLSSESNGIVAITKKRIDENTCPETQSYLLISNLII